MPTLHPVFFQVCPGLNGNKNQIPYNKHHKVKGLKNTQTKSSRSSYSLYGDSFPIVNSRTDAKVQEKLSWTLYRSPPGLVRE